MAGQTLVTIADRRLEERLHRRDPCPGGDGLAPLTALDVEQKPHDDHGHVVPPSSTVTDSRASIAVTVETQSGQSTTRTSP
jgi:hypothetical protein